MGSSIRHGRGRRLQASISPLHMGTALYVHAAQDMLPRRIRLVYGVLRTCPWIPLDAGGLDDIQGPEQKKKKPPTRSGQVPSFFTPGRLHSQAARASQRQGARAGPRPQGPTPPPPRLKPSRTPPGSHRGNFSQQFGQRPRPRPDGARTPFSIFLFERPVQKRHAASLISRFRIPRLLIPPHPRRLLPLSASFCFSLSGISSYTHSHANANTTTGISLGSINLISPRLTHLTPPLK